MNHTTKSTMSESSPSDSAHDAPPGTPDAKRMKTTDVPKVPAADVECCMCKRTLPVSEFPPHALKKKRCRECLRRKMAAYRGAGDDPVLRAFRNFQAMARSNNIGAGRFWKISDARDLYEKWLESAPSDVKAAMSIGRQPRLSIRRIDPELPFLPNNATFVLLTSSDQ